MQLNEQIVAGGPSDFMTARQLTVRGTNFEIGRAVGELAVKRYGMTAGPYATDPIYGRARRHYYQRHYPIFWERLRGVASVFELDPEDDRYDLSCLSYNMDVPGATTPRTPGCSVVYCPPHTTSTGSGLLSRNYDFWTGSIAGLLRLPLPDELKAQLPAIMSEPYIMEWYPVDGGYASIAIHAFDPFSGTLDGMNSAGLAVSILADDEGITRLGPAIERHPRTAQAIGLHELQVMRLLLDTCATAEEASDVLLGIKDFYGFAPLHYIVADRQGHSFIYEHSTGRNAQYVFMGTGQPQILTNFELYRHPAGDPLFDAPLSPETSAFWRYRTLSDLISRHDGLFSPDDAKAITCAVNVVTIFGPEASGRADGLHDLPVRTLWHSLYDQQAGTVEVSFYLGDEVGPNGSERERRSDYLRFSLH